MLRGRVKVYSMLLFFNLRVWADNIYRGIISSRPIYLPHNDCLIYIIHQRRTAVCATQKTVLKSELMTTRYVENSPPLPKRQKEGVLKFSRRTAVCATQKTVLKSELMLTRYVENIPPLPKRQKEGVLKFSRASPA